MKAEQQMYELRLMGMMGRYKSLEQTHQIQGLSLQEGLELLFQAETSYRNNRRTDRLIQLARFRYQASISEINYLPSRNLDRTTVASLSDNEYIKKGDFVVITGATGCGKSYLATALGYQACYMGIKTMYLPMKTMFDQLKLAKIDGTYLKYMDKIAKANLLIIDDFGLCNLDQQQAIDLMEIIEDRHAKKGTIISSQIPMAAWYDIIPDSTIADAILDRIVHTAIRIELRGDSLRKNR
jgi:DNA replication protein DnaC